MVWALWLFAAAVPVPWALWLPGPTSPRSLPTEMILWWGPDIAAASMDSWACRVPVSH